MPSTVWISAVESLVRSVYNLCWSTSTGPLSSRLECFTQMKRKAQLVLTVSSMSLGSLAKSGKIAVLLRDTEEEVDECFGIMNYFCLFIASHVVSKLAALAHPRLYQRSVFAWMNLERRLG